MEILAFLRFLNQIFDEIAYPLDELHACAPLVDRGDFNSVHTSNNLKIYDICAMRFEKCF